MSCYVVAHSDCKYFSLALEIVDVFSYVLLNSLFWSARDNNEIRVKNDGKVQELEENFFQDLEAWMEIMIQLIVNAEWTHYETGLLRSSYEL